MILHTADNDVNKYDIYEGRRKQTFFNECALVIAICRTQVLYYAWHIYVLHRLYDSSHFRRLEIAVNPLCAFFWG